MGLNLKVDIYPEHDSLLSRRGRRDVRTQPSPKQDAGPGRLFKGTVNTASYTLSPPPDPTSPLKSTRYTSPFASLPGSTECTKRG
jgi:hypothetical protein